MPGHQQVSPCEPLDETSSMWAFGAECPLMYPCLLHDTKLYASPGPVNTDIELSMTSNTLRGLTSPVSN
ncbi:hypothetical protein TNCV_3771411 [Trichonephila clavipes]|nr:hypothetical protein TNCV_3771411 [Trichonephila clavipes]